MLNRMLINSELLYKNATHDEVCGQQCAMQESVRTLQVILTQQRKFSGMRAALKHFFGSCISRFSDMSLPKIDAILSLFPELALPGVTMGAKCVDQTNGESLTVVGLLEAKQSVDKDTCLYTSTLLDKDLTDVICLISSREPPQFRRQNVSPPSLNRLISSQNDEACFHHFVKLSYYFANLRLFCVFLDEEPRPTDKSGR